jgi:hypothetical protein
VNQLAAGVERGALLGFYVDESRPHNASSLAQSNTRGISVTFCVGAALD